MSRLLPLLLVVSLLANAIAAPWAMAAMQHGAAHAHADAAAANEHAHHGMPAPDAGMPDGMACCDGMDCDCGCVLPPVLPLCGAVFTAARWSNPPAGSAPTLAALARGSPPFRPPAA